MTRKLSKARKKWSDIKSKAPAEVRERAAQKTRDMQRELLEAHGDKRFPTRTWKATEKGRQALEA